MLITVTNAGVAALVNAQNTGTLPVLVAQIGVTSTAFAPNASLTALPGELKRLSTFSGQTVAEDTIHVTIRDETADVYTMRGFGLYLNDGTLFAVYGQTNPLLEKSAQAMLLLAADIRFSQIDAASLTFGDSNWINPPATTDIPGVVELATNAEANAGTDTQRAVTPAGVNYAFQQRGPYYLDWNNFTNVPSVFPPRAHSHAWGDISNVPATFPPSAHGHAWGDISNIPAMFPPSAHSHAWGDISGTPTTFPPSAHQHTLSDITNIPSLSAGTYTPVGTASINVSAITTRPCQYMRVGTVVTVSGVVRVTPAGAGSSQIALSLPIPTTASIYWQITGMGVHDGNGSLSLAKVQASGGGGAALIGFNSAGSLTDIFFTFTYLIVL